MAQTDKNILITPNIGQTADPKIEFIGADATTAGQAITLRVYPTDNGTLSFEGSAGQLFSITNSLSGTIYSVNDVSGIPSIEVLDTGLIKLAEYSGNVLIGLATDNGTDKLQIDGSSTQTGQIKSTLATGTAPFVVDSTTAVTNLNADLLDGNHASAFSLTTHDHSDVYQPISTVLTDTTAAFTLAQETKLAGIETGATADQTAAEILAAIKTVDGSGSGIDADLLDGNHASAFALSSHTHTYAGSNSAGGPALSVANSVTFSNTGGYPVGTTFNGNSSPTITYATVGAAAASHTHAASDITSGTIATARLGSGTADATTYLRGDNTWATVSSGSTTAITTSSSLYNLSTTGFGSGAITSGCRNTLIGLQASPNISTGISNIILGAYAGTCLTTGNSNISIGSGAGYFSNASDNISIGISAGYRNSTGNSNVYIGPSAGCGSSTGSSNVVLGNAAAQGPIFSPSTINTLGDTNVVIGYNAGKEAGGTDNVYIGNSAGLGATCTSTGYACNNIGIGSQALAYTKGCANIGIGCNAGWGGVNSTGSHNISIGFSAGCSVTTGFGNIIIGDLSGKCNTTGYNSVIVGRYAGMNASTAVQNVFIGYGAGCSVTTGSYNTYIGGYTGSSHPTTSNYIFFSDNNGTLRGGFDNSSNFHAIGDVIAYTSSLSDIRIKDNISNVQDALTKLKSINGVEYTLKSNGIKKAGVIAQEVESVFPVAVTERMLLTNETYKTVHYDSIHALLIEAVKELSSKVDKLQGNKDDITN